jgi:tyrosinase
VGRLLPARHRAVPTWHRAYLYKLENALRSIPGCASVTLAFWDECCEWSQKRIPGALTWEKFELDGVLIDNPLRSFVLPVAIVDQVQQDSVSDPNSPSYSKPQATRPCVTRSRARRHPRRPAGDQRPQSGFPNRAANVKTLDANIMAWLTMPVFRAR